MIVGLDACRLGLSVVIAGAIVLFGVWIFVEWNWWKPPDWWTYVFQELERAGRVPTPLLWSAFAAMIGGMLFLAINGC